MMHSPGNPNYECLKRRAFEICLAVFRVTKLFPKGEVLGKQLQEAASKIAAALATKQISDTILNIETIRVYLAIAKHQEWLAPLNFDLLIRAYCGLAEEAERLGELGKSGRFGEKEKIDTPPPIKIFKKQIVEEDWQSDDKKRVQKRQEQIVSYLKENSPAKTADIVNFLGNVVDRTVRTDLNTLIKKGRVKKFGNNKTAQYSIEAKINAN